MAIPINSGEITIDGMLDEPAWKRAKPAGDFTQRNPSPGTPATELTSVKVLYDNEGLYIGAILYDTQPERIVADEMREDADLRRNDAFAIILDTYHDHRNGFFFETNPLGVRADAIVFNEGESVNFDWDGVWWVEAIITDKGWQVEMKIPFSTLRFDEKGLDVWGLQMRRLIRHKNEEVYWSFIPLDADVWRLSLAGHLRGLEGVRQGRAIEIKPYILSGLERIPSKGEPDTQFTKDGGVDIKYSITPNLTLDMTVNTDFAQVEADEQQINITRFPLFFPEKRDFFLEGPGFFDFGLFAKVQPFFSRRIGLVGGEEVPISIGGKLTGKVGGYSLGLLSIQTRRKGDEPETNYSIMRVKRDILMRSGVGFIAVNKEPRGEGFNRTLGVDANLTLLQHLYIDSFLLQTTTQGVEGDGGAGYLKVRWLDEFLDVYIYRLDVEDDLDPQVGFVKRAGVEENKAFIKIKPRPKGTMVRQFSLYTSLNYTTDQGTRLITRSGRIGFVTEFHSGDSFELAYQRDFDRLDEVFTLRTGLDIPIGGYSFDSFSINVATDKSRPLSGTISFSRGGYYDGDIQSYELEVNLRPYKGIGINPGLTRQEIDLPGGRFTANLINTRLEYSLTTRAFFNALLQWNDDTDEFLANLRFSYEYRPGSRFYIVYNERRDTDGQGITDRSLLLKLTYLLSI